MHFLAAAPTSYYRKRPRKKSLGKGTTSVVPPSERKMRASAPEGRFTGSVTDACESQNKRRLGAHHPSPAKTVLRRPGAKVDNFVNTHPLTKARWTEPMFPSQPP
jgi:hypothetical protein